MEKLTVEQQVEQQMKIMRAQRIEPAAVMLGHEDWLDFSSESQVSYTPFGSARRYQAALGGLLMVRINQDRGLRVVTQAELDAYAATNQIL